MIICGVTFFIGQRQSPAFPTTNRLLACELGYTIKSPVLNQTGIQGRYDLTLSFSSLDTLETLGIVPNAHPAVAGSGASGDPQGVPVMLTDAVAKQPGLKLVYETRPISVLVVDHIEEKPTDN